MPFLIFLLSTSIVNQSVLLKQPTAMVRSALTDILPLRSANYTNRQQFGSWFLNVHRDPFADEIDCRVGAPGMSFSYGVLTVRFHPSANTFEAVYRVDNKPLINAQSDVLKLAQLGLPIYQEDLANASGGLVRIPGYRIRGARQVQIELNRGGRVYTQNLSRLGDALIAAQQAGCKDIGDL